MFALRSNAASRSACDFSRKPWINAAASSNFGGDNVFSSSTMISSVLTMMTLLIFPRLASVRLPTSPCADYDSS
jgi:hypothetical protein